MQCGTWSPAVRKYAKRCRETNVIAFTFTGTLMLLVDEEDDNKKIAFPFYLIQFKYNFPVPKSNWSTHRLNKFRICRYCWMLVSCQRPRRRYPTFRRSMVVGLWSFIEELHLSRFVPFKGVIHSGMQFIHCIH